MTETPTQELTLSDLHGQLVDEGNRKEATRFRTVPTGGYNALAEPEPFKKGDNPDITSLHGRWFIHCTVPIYVLDDATGEARRAGMVFCDLSPEVRRWASGEMDGPSKLYYQAVTALQKADAISEKATHKDVYEAIRKFPMYFYVTEFFRVPQGDGSTKRVTIRDNDTGKALKAKLIAQGLAPMNGVSTISAYKEQVGEEAEEAK